MSDVSQLGSVFLDPSSLGGLGSSRIQESNVVSAVAPCFQGMSGAVLPGLCDLSDHEWSHVLGWGEGGLPADGIAGMEVTPPIVPPQAGVLSNRNSRSRSSAPYQRIPRCTKTYTEEQLALAYAHSIERNVGARVKLRRKLKSITSGPGDLQALIMQIRRHPERYEHSQARYEAAPAAYEAALAAYDEAAPAAYEAAPAAYEAALAAYEEAAPAAYEAAPASDKALPTLAQLMSSGGELEVGGRVFQYSSTVFKLAAHDTKHYRRKLAQLIEDRETRVVLLDMVSNVKEAEGLPTRRCYERYTWTSEQMRAAVVAYNTPNPENREKLRTLVPNAYARHALRERVRSRTQAILSSP